MLRVVRASRRFVLPCLVLALVGLLAGCQAGRGQRQLGFEPQAIKVVGLYRHTPSGMEFPTDVGEFKRASLLRHDRVGLSISARYEIEGASSKIVATVFVYPGAVGTFSSRPELCNRELQAATEDVERYYVGARPTATDDVSLEQNGVTRHGRHTAFEYDEPAANSERLPRTVQLYMFCNAADKWQVKYVVSYPRALTAGPIIDDFMQRLIWTLQPTS
jgi:hypothetical protein